MRISEASRPWRKRYVERIAAALAEYAAA